MGSLKRKKERKGKRICRHLLRHGSLSDLLCGKAFGQAKMSSAKTELQFASLLRKQLLLCVIFNNVCVWLFSVNGLQQMLQALCLPLCSVNCLLLLVVTAAIWYSGSWIHSYSTRYKALSLTTTLCTVRLSLSLSSINSILSFSTIFSLSHRLHGTPLVLSLRIMKPSVALSSSVIYTQISTAKTQHCAPLSLSPLSDTIFPLSSKFSDSLSCRSAAIWVTGSPQRN